MITPRFALINLDKLDDDIKRLKGEQEIAGMALLASGRLMQLLILKEELIPLTQPSKFEDKVTIKEAADFLCMTTQNLNKHIKNKNIPIEVFSSRKRFLSRETFNLLKTLLR